MDDKEKEGFINDIALMNVLDEEFSKDEIIAILVACIDKIFNGDYEKMVKYLERMKNSDLRLR